MQAIPHSANRTLITVFSLHMMGAIHNAGKYVEFSIEEDRWSDEIFNPVLKIEDGKVAIPDQPGWGVEINKDWLEKCERMVSRSDE
jgi:L-alanine-DL-glutamate epimerase-like enolase superfamily enzyme